MRIKTKIPIKRKSQEEFGEIAYQVTGHAFEIHDELGPTFFESTYRAALKACLGGRAVEEVCVDLAYRDFKKQLFIDLVVDDGGVFELKATSNLNSNHESQLIQYLMLTDVSHGKLINFGAEKVEHRFVNCHESADDRRRFQVEHFNWSGDICENFKHTIVELLADGGTGLTRSLYRETLAWLYQVSEVERFVTTKWKGRPIARQAADLIAPFTAFFVTCKRRDIERQRKHITKFLNNTDLHAVLWANNVSGHVRLEQIHK